MRSLKNAVLLGAASIVLSACGGGSNNAPTSPATSSAPVAQSEYDRQTKAARTQFEQRLADNLAKANFWMETNGREDGVIVTQSGLQYKINTPSSNPSGKRYQGDETVIVHYEGRLTDGTVFDSSFNRGRPEHL